MKVCTKCKQAKEEIHFSKRALSYDGFQTWCKDCMKAKKQEKRYYEKYKKDPVYIKNKSISDTKYLARNATKRRSRDLLRKAVQHGRIIKPLVCSMCGAEGIIHGHHEDYKKPFDVVWVCPCCHGDIHRELNSLGKKTNQGDWSKGGRDSFRARKGGLI